MEEASRRSRKKGKWTDHAMTTFNNGYRMEQVCKKYEIPRTSPRNRYNGRTRSTKIGPRTILITIEEELIKDMEKMVS